MMKKKVEIKMIQNSFSRFYLIDSSNHIELTAESQNALCSLLSIVYCLLSTVYSIFDIDQADISLAKVIQSHQAKSSKIEEYEAKLR